MTIRKNKSGNMANYSFFIRNLHFRNDVKELSLNGILHLMPDNRQRLFNAYLFGGIAVFAHNPRARLPVDEGAIKKQRWVSLKPLGTEGQGSEGYARPYSLVKLAVPVWFGISYKITYQFKIAGEVGMRFTNSDYLDDVSRDYPNPDVFTSNNPGGDNSQAQAMSNRILERYEARRASQDRTVILRKYLNLNENIDPIEYLRSNPDGISSIRGDSPTKNDAYLLGTIKLVYILQSPVRCPPLR